MKLPLRTNITLALGLGLFLMALSTGTSYLTLNALLEGEQHEEKIQVTVVLLERLVSQFKTTESLQRRYLLTNIDKDLASYRQARAGLQQVLRGAGDLPMAGESLQDLRTLQGLIGRRLDLMESAVSARQQAGLEAAAAIVGSDLNRQLHNDIEELIGRTKSAQTLTLERSEQNARRTAQTVRLLILLSGLLSLGLLGWTVRAVIRAQANNRRIQAELADSEAMSRAITESMADGVITATPEGLIVNANSAPGTCSAIGSRTCWSSRWPCFCRCAGSRVFPLFSPPWATARQASGSPIPRSWRCAAMAASFPSMCPSATSMCAGGGFSRPSSATFPSASTPLMRCATARSSCAS